MCVSSSPNAAETGEELSHRVGLGASLSSGQSADAGRTWLESAREDATTQTLSRG